MSQEKKSTQKKIVKLSSSVTWSLNLSFTFVLKKGNAILGHFNFINFILYRKER